MTCALTLSIIFAIKLITLISLFITSIEAEDSLPLYQFLCKVLTIQDANCSDIYHSYDVDNQDAYFDNE